MIELRHRPLNHRRVAENKVWWVEKSKEYPFQAEAPISIRPDWVDSALRTQIASVPLRTGWRTYGFKTPEKLDEFLMLYPSARKLTDA